MYLYVYMFGTLCQYSVFLVYSVASDCCIYHCGGHPSHLISARQEWTDIQVARQLPAATEMLQWISSRMSLMEDFGGMWS